MRILICLLMAVFLSGCQVVQENYTSMGKKGMKPDHGLVAFQLVSNTERTGFYHPYWDEIVLYKVDEELDRKTDGKSKVYPIRRVRQEGKDVHFYVGQVPAGEYIVGRLWSEYRSDGLSSTQTIMVSHLRTVEVERGKTTDGGTYVYQPVTPAFEQLALHDVGYGVSTRRNLTAYTSYTDQNEYSVETVIKAFMKNVNARTSKWDVSLGSQYFQNIIPAKPQTEYEAKFLTAMLSFSDIQALKRDGSDLLALGRLGQVVNITTDKRTSIPTLNSVLNHIDLNGRDIYLLSDGNIVDNEGLPVFEELRSQYVKWMGSNDNEVYVVTLDSESADIYSLKLPSEKLSLVGSLKDTDDQLSAYFNSKSQFSIIIDDYLYVYDVENVTWSKHSSDAYLKVARQENNALVSIEAGGFGSATELSYSLDEGLTWKSRDRDHLWGLYLPEHSLPFYSNEKLYGLSSQKDSSNKQMIYFSVYDPTFRRKKSTKWIPVSQVNKECYDIAANVSSDEEIFLICEGGEVKVSRNLGLSWESLNQRGLEKLNASIEGIKEQYKQAKAE